MSVSTFELTDSLLRRIAEIHSYPIEKFEDEMILFGIRGVLPPKSVEDLSYDFSEYMTFKKKHDLQLVKVNYYFPRCMIGQWIPSKKTVAIFPGSTVPNLLEIKRKKYKMNEFNQLIPGFYSFKKGPHPLSRERGKHKAFRMQGRVVLRRNSYKVNENGLPTISYSPHDSKIIVMNPLDNIHAARNNPKSSKAKRSPNLFHYVLSSRYSSLGCQVIVGNAIQFLPAGTNGNWNAWDKFYESGYNSSFSKDQKAFKYMLFTGKEAVEVSKQNSSGLTDLVLNYGSEGDIVQNLQLELKKKHSAKSGKPYYSKKVDKVFGTGMTNSIIKFVKENINYSYPNLSHSVSDLECFVSSEAGRVLGYSDWPKR